jgi:hypothetical protein
MDASKFDAMHYLGALPWLTSAAHQHRAVLPALGAAACLHRPGLRWHAACKSPGEENAPCLGHLQEKQV